MHLQLFSKFRSRHSQKIFRVLIRNGSYSDVLQTNWSVSSGLLNLSSKKFCGNAFSGSGVFLCYRPTEERRQFRRHPSVFGAPQVMSSTSTVSSMSGMTPTYQVVHSFSSSFDGCKLRFKPREPAYMRTRKLVTVYILNYPHTLAYTNMNGS